MTGARRVVIVGFGLIGGSLGLALKQRWGAHVTAVDLPHVLSKAEARVIADEYLDVGAHDAIARAYSSAELIVLAGPVGAIRSELPTALASGAIVTDCGSTKRRIVEDVAALRERKAFVPGHPMAGAPDGGLGAAHADLFEGRSWILCPEGASPDAFSRVTAMVRAVGAAPLTMAAEFHDRAVALTSHVPQLLASALRALAAEAAVEGAAGPGYQSATRVAGGPASIWRDIFETNHDAIADSIGEIVRLLEQARLELSASPPALDAALALLERARASNPERES